MESISCHLPSSVRRENVSTYSFPSHLLGRFAELEGRNFIFGLMAFLPFSPQKGRGRIEKASVFAHLLFLAVAGQPYSFLPPLDPSVPQPEILTEPQVFRAGVGESLTLPCRVRNLGPMVLIWKKGTRVLTAGEMKVSCVSLVLYNVAPQRVNRANRQKLSEEGVESSYTNIAGAESRRERPRLPFLDLIYE